MPATRPYIPLNGSPNLFAWEFAEIPTELYDLPYSVVLANTGKPGTLHGALACYKTVSLFRPAYTFFVGIAGGFKKDGQTLGDVAISSAIWGYEYGKIRNSFEPRIDLSYQADISLLTHAKVFGADSKWLKLFQAYAHSGTAANAPKVRDGIILSGDKVIDDPTQDFFDAVLDKCPHALAVEMEGVGAAAAISCLVSEGVLSRFLMVRGISDRPQDKGNQQTLERDTHKSVASKNAAIFTCSLVKNGLPSEPGTSPASISRQLSSTTKGPACPDLLHQIDTKISFAVRALLGTQNKDGGIPSTRPDIESGIWTSASTLESLSISSSSPLSSIIACRKIASYILDNQINSAWPVVCVSEGCHCNTISTAHCISALSAFKAFVPIGDTRRKIEAAIRNALVWLFASQNADGGWGLEPSSIKDAIESRVSATYYAVKAIRDANAANVTDKLMLAADFLLRKKLAAGGWANADDHDGVYEPDASNTARASLALLYTGKWQTGDADLTNTINLLLEKRTGGSWEIDSESLPSKNPSGQTVYYNNAPCDVLNLLITCRSTQDLLLKPLHFILSHLNSEGFLPLIDPMKKKPRSPAITWPTSEFIYTSSIALAYLSSQINS